MPSSIHKYHAINENHSFNIMGRIHAGLSRKVDKQELEDLTKELESARVDRDGDRFEKVMVKFIVKTAVIKARDGVSLLTEPLDALMGTARERQKPDPKARPGKAQTKSYQKAGDKGALRATVSGGVKVAVAVGLITAPLYGAGIPILIGAGVTHIAAKAGSQIVAAPSAAIKQTTNTTTRLVVLPFAKAKARQLRREFDALVNQGADMGEGSVMGAEATSTFAESLRDDVSEWDYTDTPVEPSTLIG